MNEELTLIDIIADRLTAAGVTCGIEVIGDREAVEVQYTGEDEFLPEDCSITVEEPEKGIRAVNFLVTVISGLDSEQTAKLRKVTARFNQFLRIGSFSVMKDGVLFFSYAFAFDEELPVVNLLTSVFASLETVSSTASEGKDMLMPLISGEITCEELIAQGIFPDN